MDSQYHSASLYSSATSHAANSLSNHPNQQALRDQAQGHHSVQSAAGAMQQQVFGSLPGTPRTPATPNTPAAANSVHSYGQSQASGPGVTRAAYPAMGASAYSSYPNSSSMMAQPAPNASQPQQLQATTTTASNRPPILRPNPPMQPMNSPGMVPQGMPNYPTSMMPQPSPVYASGGEPNTHVVGSQGRRGILPSAPGRPPAPTGGVKNAQIPPKDADGKFPCPHCPKAYLHSKHLKRHLLRHTGDRPYMCVLCSDTFSRSDILKRHFQKCSIRRGNPQGVTHLSHPSAHVKNQKRAMQEQGNMAADGSVSHMNGLQGMQAMQDGVGYGSHPLGDGMSTLSQDQAQLSRASSLSRVDDNSTSSRDQRQQIPTTVGVMTSQSQYPTLSAGTMQNYGMAHSGTPPNGMVYNGQGQVQGGAPAGGLEWNAPFYQNQQQAAAAAAAAVANQHQAGAHQRVKQEYKQEY